jgi:hypothetical protein
VAVPLGVALEVAVLPAEAVAAAQDNTRNKFAGSNTTACTGHRAVDCTRTHRAVAEQDSSIEDSWKNLWHIPGHPNPG